jgi:hypothetical protein
MKQESEFRHLSCGYQTLKLLIEPICFWSGSILQTSNAIELFPQIWKSPLFSAFIHPHHQMRWWQWSKIRRTLDSSILWKADILNCRCGANDCDFFGFVSVCQSRFKKFCSSISLRQFSRDKLSDEVTLAPEDGALKTVRYWLIQSNTGNHIAVPAAPFLQEILRMMDEWIFLATEVQFIFLNYPLQHDRVGFDGNGILVPTFLVIEIWEISRNIFLQICV